MAALLTSEISKPDNVVKYIGECREMGIPVVPPDVQVSGAQFTLQHGEAIRFGLAAVKNAGGNAIESILKARAEVGGHFRSFWEFCDKVDLRVMNKRVIESLIKAGALDSLGKRGQLSAAVDRAMERAQKAQKDAAQGQTGLFGLFDEAPAPGRNTDDLPHAADWEESERLANEKEVLGFFVSGHPLDKYAEKLRNLPGVISVAEALERKPPERRGAGSPTPPTRFRWPESSTGLRVQKSRRDQKLYAQAQLEDATGKIDLICFSRDYERSGRAAQDGSAGPHPRMLMGEEDAAPKISHHLHPGSRRCAGEAPDGRAHPHQPRSRHGRDVRRAARSPPKPRPVPARSCFTSKRRASTPSSSSPKMTVAADRGWIERVEQIVAAAQCRQWDSNVRADSPSRQSGAYSLLLC